MSALGSALLICGWVAGVVAVVATIRALEQIVYPSGPVRRLVIALSAGVLVSLWLPWVRSANGQFTLSGWSGLDAASVVALVLVTASIATLAFLPDRGGEHREVLSMTLSLSLLGIVAGNVLVGRSGAWDGELVWGALITLALAVALAVGETQRHVRGTETGSPDPHPLMPRT